MSKIGLGTVQFGVDYGVNSSRGKVQACEVEKILNFARAKGIDLLDTAPAYGDCERVLGSCDVKDFRVMTKTRHFSGDVIGSRELSILKSDFSCSLGELKLESVYGLLVHNSVDLLKPGSKALFDWLYYLKRTGKICKIGVSIYDYTHLDVILQNFDIDLVQLPVNILDQRLVSSGMLEKLQNKGVEVHARSVFLQGLLLMNKQSRPDQFKRWSNLWTVWDEWLSDNRMTALEASIRYVLTLPGVSQALVGVDSEAQLKEIVASACGLLPEIPKELCLDDVQLLNPSNWEGV